MPVRSGRPDAVRGAAADKLGLPSEPGGIGLGRLRHWAAAGSEIRTVIAVAASGIRMMRPLYVAVLLKGSLDQGAKVQGCTKRHAGC